jgi:hypothetical protein
MFCTVIYFRGTDTNSKWMLSFVFCLICMCNGYRNVVLLLINETGSKKVRC